MFSAQRRSPDFPFYDGRPVAISAAGWAMLMASLAVAFAALTMVANPYVAAILFVGIPLLALAAVAGRSWTALFRSVGWRELGIMLLVAIATMAASIAAALLLHRFTPGVGNPVIQSMAAMSAHDYLRRLAPTAPQLLGEELLTILPFLAILWLLTTRLGVSRRVGLLAAATGSTAVFAAAHLPTYEWRWLQCFGVIGTARLVLTLGYIWTRNLWVSTGAHVLNDWTEFSFVWAVGHMPIGTPA